MDLNRYFIALALLALAFLAERWARGRTAPPWLRTAPPWLSWLARRVEIPPTVIVWAGLGLVAVVAWALITRPFFLRRPAVRAAQLRVCEERANRPHMPPAELTLCLARYGWPARAQIEVLQRKTDVLRQMVQ